MSPEQILAIKCAYADLVGSKQSFDQSDALQQSIDDLEAAFPDLNLGA